MPQILLYVLHGTSLLSFYIDVVLTLSISDIEHGERYYWHVHDARVVMHAGIAN